MKHTHTETHIFLLDPLYKTLKTELHEAPKIKSTIKNLNKVKGVSRSKRVKLIQASFLL